MRLNARERRNTNWAKVAACIEDETCHAGLMTTNTCMTCGRYADRTGNMYQYGVRKYGGDNNDDFINVVCASRNDDWR